ncbi:MAG TPA: hypothetical protein VGD98_14805 [Ktedonobacteraceae bacterium]
MSHEEKHSEHRDPSDKLKGKAEEISEKTQKQGNKMGEELKNKTREAKDATQAKAADADYKTRRENDR